MAAEITAGEAAGFDYMPYLQRCERARLLLDLAQRSDEQHYAAAAHELCDFFQVLIADEVFWTVVDRVIADPPIDLGDLFASLHEFERQEFDLLLRAGVSELLAAELAGDLAAVLSRYQAGSLMPAAELRRCIDRIAIEICSAEAALHTQEHRGVVLRWLVRAMKAAKHVVAAGVDIVAPAPINVVSTVGALHGLSEECLQISRDLD